MSVPGSPDRTGINNDENNYCFFGSGETGMNLYVLTRTMKIVQYTKGPASGPLFRHGATGRLIVFLVDDPPRGRPSGGGGVHRN
jgi:hypothetical protein